jgi:Zn-dependent protease with chaperone function
MTGLRRRWAAVFTFWLGGIVLAAPAWALSVADEVRLGRRVAAEVRDYNLVEDPSLVSIGRRLSPVMQRKDLPWRFWVIEDLDSYNAFAAPGGFVFITRKYYQKLSDDEAAFVIAHEMAHIDLRHYEKQVKRHRNASLGRLLLDILTGGASGWRTAADVGATAYVTHYSRNLEREADFAGYGYAEAAGYDARAAVTALSKLGEQPKIHPWIVNIYSTHPILSSREDRLAALGGEEPEQIEPPASAPSHTPDVTAGLQPFEPPVPIAVRILAPDGARWENRWRKNFTKRLHLRLTPIGFEIAGDDIMYKPHIGDPVEAARNRGAEYLLLVTVHTMESVATAAAGLQGTPVRASIDVGARLVRVRDAGQVKDTRIAEEDEGLDVLTIDPEILYPDTTLGALANEVAGQIAIACARAAGAKPLKAE